MKRLLIATTAAVTLVGSAAYAEVTVKGDAWMGLAHDSTSAMDFNVKHRFRVIFGASGTSDGGLTFGAGAKIDSNNATTQDNEKGAGGDPDTKQRVTTSTVHIGGAFGTLTFGDNDAADLQAGGVADLGFDGIGVDDVAETGGGRGGTNSAIRYDQSIGGVALAASFGPDATGDIEYALGMSFTSNGITIGAGFDSDDGMALGAGYALNDELKVNGWYGEEGTMDGMGGDLSYGLGATTLSVAFATNSQDHKAAGLGLSHDLGGGGKLVAGFGQIDGAMEKSAAEVGLTFEF